MAQIIFANRVSSPTAKTSNAILTPHRIFLVGLLFFAVSTGIGAYLRGQVAFGWPLGNYGYLLHTHSHAAFLGWVFNAFYALAWAYLIPVERRRKFTVLFLVLQIANLGMLFSFPFQGYGPVSISFTTLHTIGSIFFAVWLWSGTKLSKVAQKYLRAALVFLLVSALGPILLGPLAAMDLRDSPWYDLAVYWYLHFSYNGWFIAFLLAMAAPVFRLSDKDPITALARKVFPFFLLGVVGTFLGSVLWLHPPLWVYALSFLFALIQLAALTALLFTGWRTLSTPTAYSWETRWLLSLGMTALWVKALFQVAGSLPQLDALTHNHFTVIGFLHWVFLLVVTPVLFVWARYYGILQASRGHQFGLSLFFSGVLGSKVILLGLPLGLPLPFSSATSLFYLASVKAAGLFLVVITSIALSRQTR